jgi:hypothetical protein
MRTLLTFSLKAWLLNGLQLYANSSVVGDCSAERES